MARRDEGELPLPEGEPLTFPDLPRLELDQLLAQLVDRAHEVMATQGRLRGLLRANQLVSRDLSSAAVLRSAAEAARDLVGARWAGLEVSASGGSPAESAEVGRCGSGGGELDVPVQVRGRVLGTLRLRGSSSGRFSAEDGELARALAATAGLAIQNARLYESARRRGEWLQASAAITGELLTSTDGGVGALDRVARGVRDVARADVVAVLRPEQAPATGTRLGVDVLVGGGEPAPPGQPVLLGDSLLGRVFTGGRSVCLPHGADQHVGTLPWAGLDVGPVLAVPLVGQGGVRGVLCAARLPGAPEFSATDVEMAGSLANQATVALELADARAERERAAVLDERERIATDLHDSVVQRLFGVGLSLQGVLADLGAGRAADRVRATVEEVDRTINHIRSALFPLDGQPAQLPADPRDRVLDVVTELLPALGLEPDLRFSGLAGGSVAADLLEDLTVVVREALLDVARRGRATAASVDVVEDRDGLVVHVRDDDTGGPDRCTDEVEQSLRRRAERHGGTCTVSAGSPAGTSLYWWVPRR